MADTKNAQPSEVKLEDLLRLKRGERPDDAFWNTFDRELHQRMLQTLVKKDPWYVQLMRGVSGRIAQTTAVGAAAAFLAMMVVRPAFVDSTLPGGSPSVASVASVVQQPVEAIAQSPVEVTMTDFEASMTRDYQIEAISADNASSDLGYTKDYTHDTFEVAAYDRDAYMTDTASFAGTGLATGLVY